MHIIGLEVDNTMVSQILVPLIIMVLKGYDTRLPKRAMGRGELCNLVPLVQ
jgi:hypothetical protein